MHPSKRSCNIKLQFLAIGDLKSKHYLTIYNFTSCLIEQWIHNEQGYFFNWHFQDKQQLSRKERIVFKGGIHSRVGSILLDVKIVLKLSHFGLILFKDGYNSRAGTNCRNKVGNRTINKGNRPHKSHFCLRVKDLL